MIVVVIHSKTRIMVENDMDLWQRIREVKGDLTRTEAHLPHIVQGAIDYWDQHPHSAMESLESIAHALPFKFAQVAIREIVMQWKSKANYSWRAGGSADHCFLSALFLSGNEDLAEETFVANCLSSILEKSQRARSDTVDAELKFASLLAAARRHGRHG